MSRCNAGTYLVVHDARLPSEPRAGLITVTGATAPSFEPVRILDEDLPGGHLVDLEALASIPGRLMEFLAIESGAPADGRAARRLLVHLRLLSAAAGGRELRIAGAINVLVATSALENCEGLACWAHDSALRVLLADCARGRPRRDPAEVAMVAGALELHHTVGDDPGLASAVAPAPAPMRFTPHRSEDRFRLHVPLKAAGSWRLCSDLHADANGTLWGGCAQDLGADGPLRSRVYRAGAIDPEDGWPRLRKAAFEHDVDGLKVEALAACDLPRASLCFATDDENYGGVWRPLRSSASSGDR